MSGSRVTSKAKIEQENRPCVHIKNACPHDDENEDRHFGLFSDRLGIK